MLQSGQEFAHFKIIRKLGEGGMGAVFLAEDQKLGRQVALKILPQEFFADAERRERFEREARVAAQINHSNVTSIFDLGYEKEPGGDRTLVYIVMEYVPGEHLRDYMASHSLEMSDVLRLAEKIASGLVAAHKLKIVHRDIKPENILINEEGEPRILDFGLAKPLDAPLQMQADEETMAAGLTQAGRIIGTVNYMSPEQAQGGLLDTRSDIFSFGILLYRLATGDAPFSGPTQMTILAKIIEGSHDPAHTRNEAVDPELERIIDKCLKKDPADRYQDTQGLVEDLRQLRRQYDSGLTHSNPSGQANAAIEQSPNKSGSRKVTRMIAVLVVVIAVAGFFLGRSGGGGEAVVQAGENRLAILGFNNKMGNEQLEWLSSGLPEILLTDLSQYADLNLVSLEQVEDELRRSGLDPEARLSRSQWLEASQRLGATSVLSGSYFKLGDKIRIDARLVDSASGKILFADKVVGEDAFALVDNLADVVTAKLELAQEAHVGSVREMMTDSQDAYRAYHLGAQKLLLGFDREARVYFEEALAADSTFALAYLRIGMTHIFNGRPQLGAQFIRKALRFQDKLPPREKGLLDIYADTFVNQEYGDVYTKMQAFVNAYPEDKEARSIYGILIVAFSADTTRAFAEFDKVLEQDPSYPLVLQFYSQQLAQFKQYDRALGYMRVLKAAYPESPTPYQQIPSLLESQGKWQEAMKAYDEYRERFPDKPDVLGDMTRLAVRMRQFDKAQSYVDDIARVRPDDVQWARISETLRANLANWRGHFRDGLRHYHKAHEFAKAMDDTLVIDAALQTLALYFGRFDMPDSALVYQKMAYEIAPPQNRMSYPITMVVYYPERADEARPLLMEAERQFHRYMPRELWGMTQLNIDIFEAYAARDTSRIIEEYKKIQQLPANQRGGDNVRQLAVFQARRGSYAEALENLKEAIGRQSPTSSAWRYLTMTYWMGVCHEGLGEMDAAREKYQEVLEYWNDADIELESIRGARQRLARLTG